MDYVQNIAQGVSTVGTVVAFVNPPLGIAMASIGGVANGVINVYRGSYVWGTVEIVLSVIPYAGKAVRVVASTGGRVGSTLFMGRVGETKIIRLFSETPWYRFLSPRYRGVIDNIVTEGRTWQAIARTRMHEIRHVLDIEKFPQLAHFLTKKGYFPGSGFVRYWFEYRGYRFGGQLISPFTPFRSFNKTQIKYFLGDLGIFGGGGSLAIAANIWYPWWRNE